jgi:diadenosine tetraphosphate (Ap4A) HIT family hydrolase
VSKTPSAHVRRVEGCPFCDPGEDRVIFESDLIRGLWDSFPVSGGHALLVPKRHVAGWFGADAAEQAALLAGIARVREAIESRFHPDAYNIGINSGAAAGQTVPHLHIHVIPRYEGDVPDPRGGIRWVIPEKADYWSNPG